MYTQLELPTLAPAPPALGRIGRIQNWTLASAPDLWVLWRQQFRSEDEAIATAVWMANRLVKDKAKSTRMIFYSIKDEFIRRYGRVGRRAREETLVCRDCGGSRENVWGEPCEHCDGTGVYLSRWLYVHEFTVEGQRYCLHSYVAPVELLDAKADDANEQYGGRFGEAELAALALPVSGLVKLLGYVAAAKWGMRCEGGRYV